MMRTTKILVALALTMSVCGQSLADMSSFGFTEGNLSARAEFFANGDTLVVRLFNTATTDVQNPGHVLTGLFFDIIGYTGTGLTTVSALLFDLSGTPVLFPGNTTQPGTGYNNFAGAGDIGSEIAYKLGAAGVILGTGDHAIGHVGMDDFLGLQWMGNVDLFDTNLAHDLQNPGSPNGIEYGIVNPTYTGGANRPLNGPNALVTTGVVYTFTGFSGFNASHITNVSYNYGTTFNPVPAASAIGLGVIGLTLVAGLRRRL